jgi:hypothetical protein
MKTCNECEYHIRAGVKDTAFFYHVCTYKLNHEGKSRVISGKGEEPYIPDWCPKVAQ